MQEWLRKRVKLYMLSYILNGAVSWMVFLTGTSGAYAALADTPLLTPDQYRQLLMSPMPDQYQQQVIAKAPFRYKHPKVYKAYRGARHVCIIVEPFVRTAGSIAQILTAFK